MSRKLPSWLAGWLDYSSNLESPEIFRVWSGLGAISAALQRKCHTVVKGQRLYPNLFVILVGPPGVGKGNAMKPPLGWLRNIDALSIAPDTITKRAFFEKLEDSAASMPDDPLDIHHSLTAYIEELGVFLQANDTDFIYSLCHVFDTPEFFHYKTATAGEHLINKVWFSFVAGATPKAIKDILSEQAMELGISARTILVFSDEKIDVDIFGVPSKNAALEKDLIDDLDHISLLHGEWTFDNEAAEAIVAWSREGFLPIPTDPRFEHYNARRFVHTVKLCVCFAASVRDEPIIVLDDFNLAKKTLLRTEQQMPKAIKSLGANPLLDSANTARAIINKVWDASGQPTPEAQLRRQLEANVAPYLMDSLMDSLAAGRWIRWKGDSPGRLFWPMGKTVGKKAEEEE